MPPSAAAPPDAPLRVADLRSAEPAPPWDCPVGFDQTPPTDEELWGLIPDPDSDPPDDANGRLAGATTTALLREDRPGTAEPAEALWEARPGAAESAEALRAGILARDSAHGAGFASGGIADYMPPGVALAGFAADVWRAGLGRITDDELIGVLRAWRRLTSWAVAGELAAVAELNRRRTAEVAAGADPHLAEHVGDELAVPLTLTTWGADQLLGFACQLDRLPRTRAALAAGEIDRSKALAITDEVCCLDDAHAAAVEAAVIGRAPGQTTGQLRAATRRAVLAADPGAARRHREKAQKEARVEVWSEHSGTAALAGRDLPPADVLAADKRISALASQLKAAGVEGNLDQLRARAYTALLLGRPIESALPSLPSCARLRPRGETRTSASGGSATGGATGRAGDAPRTGGGPHPMGAFTPALPGSVNLTMPLAAWLGVSDTPGDVAGFGPVCADDGRALAGLLASGPGTRWCLTLTGLDGTAVAHGCAQIRQDAGSRSRPDGRDWALTVTVRPLANGDCHHERESKGYWPSASLRHLITIRQRTCSFPGCRRPAVRCDQDHTVAYDQGGRTCECNLSPSCKR